MLNIKQIENNKDKILQENIFPNVCWNRFDLRFGNDYKLSKINDLLWRGYVASHIEGTTIYVSLYLREMNKDTFNEYAKYLFEIYPDAKDLFVLHTYTNTAGVEQNVHWHVDLPESIEEFDATLSRRVRYNTKWYPKKIRENIGEYTIKYINANDCPDDIVMTYFKWKNQTHGTDYGLSPKQYLQKFCVTGVYVMQTDTEVLAIGFISETGDNVFFENFSYNQEYAKYSPGMVLYHYLISDIITRGKKKLYLLGGNLEYKKHFNGIPTMTYTGMLPREQFIYPQWIDVLARITPKCLSKIITFLLPHRYQKRAFSAQLKKYL